MPNTTHGLSFMAIHILWNGPNIFQNIGNQIEFAKNLYSVRFLLAANPLAQGLGNNETYFGRYAERMKRFKTTFH